jgi:hypothetical protein
MGWLSGLFGGGGKGKRFVLYRNGKSEGVVEIKGETETMGRPAYIFTDGRVLTKKEVQAALEGEAIVGGDRIKMVAK